MEDSIIPIDVTGRKNGFTPNLHSENMVQRYTYSSANHMQSW